MLIKEIIAAKRDGRSLTAEQIGFVVDSLTNETMSEGQVAAFAMAVFFRGLKTEERVWLTRAMRDSGNVLTWNLPGPVIDKHSTGGIGDNVSLVLAPALAACGGFVPMISGRGLGHTGGTLDKFDAIPGYQTQPDVETLARVVEEVGCAIIGQTPDMAPADKRFYAIRDISGTIESLDLITASILSKKLAAGLDALVLDVKVGSGAFMPHVEAARQLANSLTEVANGAGCATSALITDMNEPLASAAGNALEVSNAVRFLRGDAIDSRLWDVVIALGAELLVKAKISADAETGREAIVQSFLSGRAAEVFGRMVAALGGPSGFVETFDSHLPTSQASADVYADRSGFVSEIDTRALGIAVVELGGGRQRATDKIDHTVGFEALLGLGATVEPDTPLARIHASNSSALEVARQRLRSAYVVDEKPPKIGPLIVQTIN
ncbi:MAG: thymidine phosphorylase [Pseudomonadota bacterium]